jgi:hypothetical protein
VATSLHGRAWVCWVSRRHPGRVEGVQAARPGAARATAGAVTRCRPDTCPRPAVLPRLRYLIRAPGRLPSRRRRTATAASPGHWRRPVPCNSGRGDRGQ